MILVFLVLDLGKVLKTLSRKYEYSNDKKCPEVGRMSLGYDVSPLFHRLASTERVVLVLDTSPSMLQTDYLPTRLEAAKRAAEEFLDKKWGIDERDEVAVVSFSASARKKCDFAPVGDHRDRLLAKIAKLRCGWLEGGTAIGEGLKMAAKILGVNLDSKESGKHFGSYTFRIVVLSDGAQNVGCDPLEIADRLKAAGVVIDAVVIGKTAVEKKGDASKVNEELLKTIASPGRYQYIDEASKLIKHFSDIADKVSTGAQDNEIRKPPKASVFSRLGQPLASVWFSIGHVRRIKADSVYVGQLCLNEQDEQARFRPGDLLVICPTCKRPHHLDCWVWNGNRCFSGKIHCPGKGIPLTSKTREKV